MLSTYTLSEKYSVSQSAMRTLLHGSSCWKSWGAVIGLGAGLSAPIAGSLVTVISWFADPAWHGIALHQAGTVLFVVTLPLLILGAHCLDLLDRDKKHQ